MLKESIICVVLVIAIVLGNNITQNYTKETVDKLSSNLENLREDITKQEANYDRTKNEMEEVYKIWEERHNKLAYFIEHDELEKVETELISVKSNIESNQYKDAIDELDKSIFILQHIEDKYAFNLQNIF